MPANKTSTFISFGSDTQPNRASDQIRNTSYQGSSMAVQQHRASLLRSGDQRSSLCVPQGETRIRRRRLGAARLLPTEQRRATRKTNARSEWTRLRCSAVPVQTRPAPRLMQLPLLDHVRSEKPHSILLAGAVSLSSSSQTLSLHVIRELVTCQRHNSSNYHHRWERHVRFG